MNPEFTRQLKLEIDHIFESGANEVRILNMVEAFIDKRFNNESSKVMEQYENLKWIPINNTCKSFELGDEPEVIHVIKTGFIDKYMVVFEDGYELNLGDVIYGTKSEIENKFNINLNDIKPQIETIIVPPRLVKENGLVDSDIPEEDKATLKLGIAIGLLISFFIAAIYNIFT